jgi:hypothetical protein
MCKRNFQGRLELSHLPYSGGFYEQPAVELEMILNIIGYLNMAIREEEDD